MAAEANSNDETDPLEACVDLRFGTVTASVPRFTLHKLATHQTSKTDFSRVVNRSRFIRFNRTIQPTSEPGGGVGGGRTHLLPALVI